MKEKGEITVFLSLILVCVISLLLGILESARTAGARLYLQMAADSAAASLFSQYNRNLWDMYRLLFLEADTDEAVMESYDRYIDFYMEQENLYPMKNDGSRIIEKRMLEDDAAAAFEEEILAHIMYRLPDVASNLAGITEAANEAAKAGDFKSLLETCRQAGRKTRKLEKARNSIENSLQKMEELRENGSTAIGKEQESKFRSNAGKLKAEMEKFSGYVDQYEDELEELKAYGESMEKQETLDDTEAAGWMGQEKTAYAGIIRPASEALADYRDMCDAIDGQMGCIEEALTVLDTDIGGEDEEEEYDWGEIESLWNLLEIPEGTAQGEEDKEKSEALDRLEKLLDADLLSLVLPAGTEISGKEADLSGIPSERLKDIGTISFSPEVLLINEYAFLYFNSFLEETKEMGLQGEHILSYEQEYLLGGKASDRDNLKAAAEQMLAVRGAMNLLYLLAPPDKKAEADSLAAAVSAGAVPGQFVVSFFILTLWAFGEAVMDVRCLLSGGKVPVWKDERSWKLGMEELLTLGFLEQENPGQSESGYGYEEYIRVLLLLQNRTEKNYRMLDIIQWNMRTIQPDFEVSACIYQLKIETTAVQKHVFLLKSEYQTVVSAEKKY